MRDFTLNTYALLLKKLKERKYTFLTFEQFMSLESTEPFRRSRYDGVKFSNLERRRHNGNSEISHPDNYRNQNDRGIEMTSEGRQISIHSTASNSPPPALSQHLCILRHDVDRLPYNALTTAKIENELGIKGTYYFRILPESLDVNIIKQILELGHEIGYHYEEMDSPLLVSPERREISLDERIDLAYELFKKNLEKLRSVVQVKTICMHGSPLSKYDNKLLWTKYDYHELGIIGEPYLDIDWNKFGYLTDTGRRWDGVSIRDKAPSSILPQRGRRFKTTFDIIKNINELPDKLMITIHPERWTNNWFLWTRQLVLQSVKNVVKRVLIGIKSA